MSVLTQQVRANATTIVGGIGSGGGGGGPVLTVSSINMNPTGQLNMRSAGSGGQGGFNGTVIAFDCDPSPISTIQMGWNDINKAVQITQYSNGSFTDAALQVSAILCSSINGAAPGGGAAVSTFNSLQIDNSIASGATLNMRASDVNLYSIDMVSSGTVRAAVSLGTVSSRDQVYLEPAAEVAGNLKASTITVAGFPVPVQQFGSLSLDGGGSTTVSLDYTYADPWYPFACYKGVAPVTPAAPLFVSTLGADSFLVTGTPNLPIVWNTLGN